MVLSFALAGLVAAVLVHAQERCDTAGGPVKCSDIPEIMALETSECQQYHMFVARGTDEKPPGRQGNLTRLICDQLGGAEHCGWENLDYPATNRFISDNTWCDSADVGAKNGQRQIKEYVEKCPETKLILLGYSQGASVVQDMMGGGGGPIFKCTQSFNPPNNRSEAPGANIAAAVTFGTVIRCPGESYSVGSGRKIKGEGTRSDEQCRALRPYASVMRDYCNKGDYICAVSEQPADLDHHLHYLEDNSEEVVKFVVRTVREGPKKPGFFKPAIDQLTEHYWLTGAMFFSLVLSWGVVIFFTSIRQRLAQGS